MVHRTTLVGAGLLTSLAVLTFVGAAPADADDGRGACRAPAGCGIDCDDRTAAAVGPTTVAQPPQAGANAEPIDGPENVYAHVTAGRRRGGGRIGHGRAYPRPHHRGEDDQPCLPNPVVPEAPLSVLLPLSAVGTAGAVVLVRRRRNPVVGIA